MSTLDSDSLKYILSMPQGRKLFWDILGAAGIYRQPFVPGDHDMTALNSGALNIGLMIIADCLEVSPDLTAMMMKEQGQYDNDRASKPITSTDSEQSKSGSNADNSGSDSGNSGNPGGASFDRFGL